MSGSSTVDCGILRTLGRVGQRVAAIGSPCILASIVIAASIVAPQSLGAHEIPTSVRLRIFVKPDATTLRVLIRAPLESMRDIDFPLRDSSRYLDVRRADPMIRESATTWLANSIQLYEGERLLPGRVSRTRISLPSDRAFGAYETARDHLRAAPLDSAIDLPWQQAMLDVEIEYPIQSAAARFSIDPGLARLGVRTTTILTFVTPSGAERPYEYAGDPGRVRLDPAWHHAASRFVGLGFAHILDGIDHLLFILCLVIPFRKLRPLIGVVTAFTIAHSITLIGSMVGLAPDGLWFPPLIEVLIALSILYMTIENVIGAGLERRWMMAFAFGLIHGFGFSFALRESLQFAGSHLALSLVSFNVGVEIGQIAVLLVAIPVLNAAFRRAVAERVGTIILSAFIGHTAWHWLTERWATLRLYPGTGTVGLIGLSPRLRFLLIVAMAVAVATIGYRILRDRTTRVSSDAA